MMKRIDILMVDDDAAICEALAMHLDDRGFTSHAVHNGHDLRHSLKTLTPRLIVLDQQLPDTSGYDLLTWLQTQSPDIPVLMMTGYHDMELAIQSIKTGASDYIHKPLDMTQFDQTLDRLLARQNSKTGLNTEAKDLSSTELVGSTPAMLAVSKAIAAAAQSDATVLITGESGSGKELVARAIHRHSGKTGPWVAINCAAIVETLLESELFGHEKGAFTGADQRKDGLFSHAENGTLFLDEIGEMSPALQAKLLRVLQDGTFQRVGGTQTLKTNARIIAATHRNLPQRIEEGRFRADLYYRLQVIHIPLPPLRERMADLPQLVKHLLQGINKRLKRSIKGLSEGALQKLKSHHWPGNVRELENVLTRAVALSRDDVIHTDNLQLEPATTGAPATPSTHATLEAVEKAHILAVLASVNGQKGKACSILGISRPALDRRLKAWGLM